MKEKDEKKKRTKIKRYLPLLVLCYSYHASEYATRMRENEPGGKPRIAVIL